MLSSAILPHHSKPLGPHPPLLFFHLPLKWAFVLARTLCRKAGTAKKNPQVMVILVCTKLNCAHPDHLNCLLNFELSGDSFTSYQQSPNRWHWRVMRFHCPVWKASHVQSNTCTSHMEKSSKQAEQVVLPSKRNDSLLFLTLREPKLSGYWLTTVFTEETITNDLYAV